MVFSVHGVSVELVSDGSSVAAESIGGIAEDLKHYLASSDSPLIRIRVSSNPFPEGERRTTVFRTRMAAVHGLGARRDVLYGDRSGVRLDADRRYAEVFSPEPALQYEILYMLVLSMIGEELDRRGIHRVHALGGDAGGRGFLFLLDSGAGKSTLALALRSVAGVRFVSDETPLLHRRQMLSFATRIAVSEAVLKQFGIPENETRAFRRKIFPEKYLVSLKASEIVTSRSVDVLIIDGGRSAEEPLLEPVPRWRAAVALIRNLVVGIGVAQMAEFYLRFDTRQLYRLVRTALSRSWVAARLISSCRVLRFVRCEDPVRNASYLVSQLHS